MKSLLVLAGLLAQILVPVSFNIGSSPGGGPTTFINHGVGSGSGSGTTASVSVNCSGANLYVVGVAAANADMATVGDGGTDTFTLGNTHLNTTGGGKSATWYSIGVSGATRTFSATANFPTIFVECFHYGGTGAFDSGAATGLSNFTYSNPQGCGTLTPSVANELVVAVLQVTSSSVTPPGSMNSGFTATDSQGLAGGLFYGGNMAYKIKTDSVAESPQWTSNFSAGNGSCDLSSWKP